MSGIFLKPWLILTGIFAVGIVTGSALTFAVAPHFFPPRGEMQMRDRYLQFLTRRLSLTDEQRSKIEPITTRASSELARVHGEEVERGSRIFHDANEEIMQILTPQQKDLLKQIEHDRDARMREMGQPFPPPHGNRMHHGGFDEDGPPPPGIEDVAPRARSGMNPPPPDDQGPPPAK